MFGMDVVRDSWLIAYCAHLYYHGHPSGDENIVTPLTDHENDAIIKIIAEDWYDIPEELRELFGDKEGFLATTHHVRLNERQFEYAERVSLEYIQEVRG